MCLFTLILVPERVIILDMLMMAKEIPQCEPDEDKKPTHPYSLAISKQNQDETLDKLFWHGSGSVFEYRVWKGMSMYARVEAAHCVSMCHNSGASLTGTTYNHFRAKSCTTAERVMPAVWGLGSWRARKSDGYTGIKTHISLSLSLACTKMSRKM